MTVRIAPFKGRKDEWEVDIRFEWPDGTRYRERKLAPTSSKSGAKKWGEQRERELIVRGKPSEQEVSKKQIPTLQAFWPRFIEEHCQAERLKRARSRAIGRSSRRTCCRGSGHASSTPSRTRTSRS